MITDPQAKPYYKSPITEHYIGRYAPSPTGPLHFGSLIAALASYLDAKHHHGRWHLRIDDIDHQRCRPEHTTDILKTLEAFGFEWDGEIQYQQQRLPLYETALQSLAAKALTYHCYCSRKILPQGPYPGTCRGLSEKHSKQQYSHRIQVFNHRIHFIDAIQGEYHERLAERCGDFVIYRADHMFSYHLATVVDDAELGVTHIVRGADLLDSSSRQIYLQHSLGLTQPNYSHVPIAVNTQGEKLSKQTFAEAVHPDANNQWLIQGLAFLGQDLQPDYPELEPCELLKSAAHHWQPQSIPRQASIVFAT